MLSIGGKCGANGRLARIISTVKVCTLDSVSDPDSLDPDPDLGFLVNPDPDPGPGC